MKPPPYVVVPHVELFRIVGLTGAPALVTFKEEKMAKDVCRMLCAAYEDGARVIAEDIRAVIGNGGRR